MYELNKGRLEKEAKEAEAARIRAEDEAVDKENAATAKKAKCVTLIILLTFSYRGPTGVTFSYRALARVFLTGVRVG